MGCSPEQMWKSGTVPVARSATGPGSGNRLVTGQDFTVPPESGTQVAPIGQILLFFDFVADFCPQTPVASGQSAMAISHREKT
jgi:hypothetical protein